MVPFIFGGINELVSFLGYQIIGKALAELGILTGWLNSDKANSNSRSTSRPRRYETAWAVLHEARRPRALLVDEAALAARHEEMGQQALLVDEQLAMPSDLHG